YPPTVRRLGPPAQFRQYHCIATVARRGGRIQDLLHHGVESRKDRAIAISSHASSAMTTAIAFGSLWMSSHPGTSSMGTLMVLALLCTMAAAVFFQPALMGPPRRGMSEVFK